MNEEEEEIFDKIFCEDVKHYLLDLGMKEEAVDELRVKKLKAHAISVLKEFIQAIESNDYQAIQKYLCDSPAGDNTHMVGWDNTFINFGLISNSAMDIADVINYISAPEQEGS
jgi:hypothetical protein